MYGSGRNWGSVARRLVAARPEWSVVLVDMRCHGRSTGFPPPHTVEACAADLLALEERLGFRADAVLGHSYGGKVALAHARVALGHLRMGPPATRRAAPRQIWLIDSSPSAGRPRGAAWRMLDVLRRRPGPFESRKAAQATVEDEGFTPTVAAWMAANAVRGGERRGVVRGGAVRGAAERWRWRLDPDQMEALLRDYFRTDAWEMVDGVRADAGAPEIHVVKARESGVLNEADVGRVQAAAQAGRPVRLHQVAGGHWLNAENPRAVEALLIANLR